MNSQLHLIDQSQIEALTGEIGSSKQPDILTGLDFHPCNGMLQVSLVKVSRWLEVSESSGKNDQFFTGKRVTGRGCQYFVTFPSHQQGVNLLSELGHPVILVGEAPVKFTVRTFDTTIETDSNIQNELSHGLICVGLIVGVNNISSP